jgi:hypothetical protein
MIKISSFILLKFTEVYLSFLKNESIQIGIKVLTLLNDVLKDLG